MNSHSSLDSRCVDFWTNVVLYGLKECVRVYFEIGNHDFANPQSMIPHSMTPFKLVKNDVVDNPRFLEDLGCCAVPYYPDPVKFLEDINCLKTRYPHIKTLICHQTFDGAQFSEGFYAKDAVNPVAVPFDNIISGHVHTQHAFGNVWYCGSPRWRTLSDANQDKFIYVVDFEPDGSYKILERISTSPTCKKIVKFTDQEGSPTDFRSIPANADVRIDIYGSADYISKKMVEHKASMGARCRSFPTKTKNAKLSEADGIIESFNKFSNSFVPPKGTDLKVLAKEAGERLDRIQ
jgi:DNA repair exonuclease SbcCD nuclease subunit